LQSNNSESNAKETPRTDFSQLKDAETYKEMPIEDSFANRDLDKDFLNFTKSRFEASVLPSYFSVTQTPMRETNGKYVLRLSIFRPCLATVKR
jgi:capsule polysaccharide export protein KpsE/RkpR